ncbi:MAG: hypothetical protein CL677_09110 [Bdellovibrionaceae bacterium]|nr:hypothetical protein [Pseudobdellovibrionaceae bacterium]|tara:strand:- start:495 stop:998 length:504 start_codon:yes stop_codon:yes gene_type:complete
MKILGILVAVLFSLNSFAETIGMFSSQQAVVIIQGQDTDAKNLYDAMKVTPVEDGNRLQKELVHRTMQAEDVFSLLCTSSQLNPDLVSCTLKVFPSSQAIVNTESRWLHVGINDQFDAPSVARDFNHTGDRYRGEVFKSLDEKLYIYKTFDRRGDVASFTIEFKEEE